MIPTNLLLGGAAAFGAYYLFLRKPARFIGDKAQAGDDAYVNLAQLGVPVPGIPQGAGQVIVRVTGTTAEAIQGPVTGYVMPGAAAFVPLPGGVGSGLQIPKGAVTMLTRGGKIVSL